jgi:hypothetical protein
MARELGPGPAPSEAWPADHALSASRANGLEIRAASVRGLMHRHRGQPRQDAFGIRYDEATRTLIVVVCDGVGSLPLSHEAAGHVCATLPDAYLRRRDWQNAVHDVNDSLTRLNAAGTMATTVIAVAIEFRDEGLDATIAWTGDSPVWQLDDAGWRELTATNASVDQPLHTGTVRSLPSVEPRILTSDIAVTTPIFLMTDGVGVPLAGSTQVRDQLAGWWTRPPDVFDFARQVGFARKGHVDDRTVVGLWPEGWLRR